MSARKKRWIVRDPAPPSFLTAQGDRAPLVASLLHQRGLQSPAAIDAFFSTDHRSGLHDPFLLHGMDAAVVRIAAAIAAGEQIAVYGDFDTDGVTAVALLTQAIRAMGGEITPYIPHRIREGYGLNTEAIDQLVAGGTTLLITVDCGISNTAEVAHAQAHGLDVIVTDHHTPPATLPPALALINPKQPGCAYPYKDLVGVGIAYKLVVALVRRGQKMSHGGEVRGRDLLDLVALGTVADMGPLTGENRVLVRVGIDALNTTNRPGVRALIAAAGLTQGKVTASDIGYTLGPRLNAAGRIDDALHAYQLLLAEDLAAARLIADELNRLNRERQMLSTDIQRIARERIAEQGLADARIIVLEDPQFPPGVIGLIASRLVDEFGRPVVLLAPDGDMARGSARSIPDFSMIAALTSASELFRRFGGHAAAAGFSISRENIAPLTTRLQQYAEEHLADELLAPPLMIDAEVPFTALDTTLHDALLALEPFGQANTQPLLQTSHVHVADARTVGADNAHLKLRLDAGDGGATIDAIAFRLGNLAPYFVRHPWIDVVYALELDTWNGKRTLRLNIKDLRRAQA